MNKFHMLGAAMVALSGGAHAANNVVTAAPAVQSVSINGQTFATYNAPGNSGSGTVTGDRPDTLVGAGDNGSLRVTGDRSRYVIGREGLTPLTGLSNGEFLLSQLRSVTFDWNVDQTTTSQRHAAPVGRVIVADNNGARTELIWEHVYNGGTAGTEPTLDTWTNAGATSVWYANIREPQGAQGTSQPLSTFIANSRRSDAEESTFTIVGPSGTGQGVLGISGNQLNQTLDSWSSYFSADARVIGFSFGAGSGFGTGFTGFVDNVNVTTAGGVDNINFEASAAAVGDVPEPATWGMMLLGFGAVGVASRRRRSRFVAA